MKNKLLGKVFLQFIAFVFCALIVDCSCIILINKRAPNVADFISQNIKDCEKTEKTGTVDFDFNIIDGRRGWFYSNHEATTSLLNYSDKGNTFIEFLFNDTLWNFESTQIEIAADGIGCAPNLTSKKLLDLDLVYGSYVIENYKAKENTMERDEYHCVVSETFSKELLSKSDSSLETMIGAKFSNSSNTKTFIIDGICKDTTIANCDNNNFIVACYRAFDYEHSKMILKYRAFNDKYTNFTFFKNLFYSTAWQPPISTNKNAFMILSCEKNPWIVEETISIFSEKPSKINFLVPLLFVYLVFSFFSPLLISNVIKKDDHIINVILCLVLFFGCFSISSLIVDKLILFNRHLIGKPIDIIIYELIVIILSFIFHFFGSRVFKKEMKEVICIDI